MRWKRVPPPEPCTSPDGHDSADILVHGDGIPVRVICTRCARHWQVVVFEEEDK